MTTDKVIGVDRSTWPDAKNANFILATFAKLSSAVETHGPLKETPHKATTDEAQQGQEPASHVMVTLAEPRRQATKDENKRPALILDQGDHFQSPGGLPDHITRLTSQLFERMQGGLNNPHFQFQAVNEIIWQAEQTILEHPEIAKEWACSIVEWKGIMEDIINTEPLITSEQDGQGFFANYQ